MNQYSKTLYFDIPLTQWSVINNLIKQWNDNYFNDDFHSYEAQYLTMLALIANNPQLNKKILDKFAVYLPERLYLSLRLLDPKTHQYSAKQKRYNIGIIINNLIYYFKNKYNTNPRLAFFGVFADEEIMPLFSPIYTQYKEQY